MLAGLGNGFRFLDGRRCRIDLAAARAFSADAAQAPDLCDAAGPATTTLDAWHAFRIAHGVAESGDDYALGDAFPHDVLLDQTGGVGFRKGCYVGQEVVSRMQHRGTARRRVLIASADAPARRRHRTHCRAAGRSARSAPSSGTKGLALVRIDRVKDAMDAGQPITAGDVPLSLAIPAWAGFGFPQERAGPSRRLMADRPGAPPRAWQRMLSGRRLDLLNPSPLDIEIADIAHGLARVARWNGQTTGDHAFSVAQHSLVVEAIFRELCPEATVEARLTALLHDAPEYVIGDMISPFKAVMGGSRAFTRIAGAHGLATERDQARRSARRRLVATRPPGPP